MLVPNDDIEFCCGTGYLHTLNSFSVHDECGDCGLTLSNYFSWWAGQGISEENAKDDSTASTGPTRPLALPRAKLVERFYG